MILQAFTFYSIFLLICCSNATPRVGPLVKTSLGVIRGLSSPDGDYFSFMGIPYAKVNASNPFGKAIPQEPFHDIFNAYDDGAICPQIEEFNRTTVGTLDCLHLNVYVPSTASTQNPVAVFVYIYGGGWNIGFAGRYLYGPKYFMRHDIILVTLNYRLGPYGFMCLDTPENPGNEGVKDQLLALRWIKKNIGAFGGDPNKITVGGHSAGGTSVDFQILTQHENLFDKAILQSGSTLTLFYTEPNLDSPLTLARHFGYVTSDVNEAISLLSQVDPIILIEASSYLGLGFAPCVEKAFDGVESFISDDWLRRVSIPKAQNMSILIGFTDDEIKSIYAEGMPDFVNVNVFVKYLELGFNTTGSNFEATADILRHFYMGDEEVTPENLPAFVNFHSDFRFIHPTHRTLARLLENGASNVYLYLFSYVGGRNFIRHKNNITVGGAVHADELGYMFDISYLQGTMSYDDQLMVDRLTTMWANFVKHGDPTPEISDLLPIKWSPITKNSPYYYLNLDSELTAGTRPYHRRMAIWDLFYRTNEEKIRSHTNNNAIESTKTD